MVNYIFSFPIISNFNVKLSCRSIFFYVLDYLCECPVDNLVYSVPSCVICGFRDVVQIMEGVIRRYSSLIVILYYLLNFLYIFRRGLLKILEEVVFVKFGLKKVLREVKEFRVVKKLCQMERLLGHLLSFVRLG